MQDVELNEELKDEADEALLEGLFLWVVNAGSFVVA